MPPRQKIAKLPRRPDPLAHLTRAQRAAFSGQARKAPPRTKRQKVSDKDDLPEVAEILSATTKQVFRSLDEDGDGVEVESDVEAADSSGEVGVGKDDGQGKGKGRGRGTGAGEDEGEEDGWEDEEIGSEVENKVEDEPNRPGNRKITKRRGRLPGSNGYSVDMEWSLAKAVQMYLPRTETGWRKVAHYFNSQVPKNHERSWESLKSKYGRMTKQKKPTGDGKGSKVHDLVIENERLRAAQEETAALEDDPWPESDASASHIFRPPTKKATIKPKPTALPAPPPFARSKDQQKPRPKVLEPPVIELLSSDSDIIIIPDTPPKRKPNTAHHAKKVPEVTAVKEPPVKRRKTAEQAVEGLKTVLEQVRTQNKTSEALGIAKVELFDRDRKIERLSKDLTVETEKCHQLERQLDRMAIVMAVYGIPLVPAASREGRIPPAIPADAVLATPATTHSTNEDSGTPQPACLTTTLSASGSNIDSAEQLADLAPDEPTNLQAVSSTLVEASGSNLSAAEKGKLPVYFGVN